ncbi:ABC transporter substrate-binding protein [Enterovirga rhinocerotis]|uniref:NitT/TauT family transport system substrate-binding protein n=1 Tax=Enterovirga rhinocerotis TaxID=1339210 RepID=A0A4R7C053_9HYPH|nr:ABC transporter substrate-binding protein [Enterovirga rhinocerotis]TDR90425.1 NitT/TauT family transport system substrate-binding protein [Enterovirga rhinocerotis]
MNWTHGRLGRREFLAGAAAVSTGVLSRPALAKSEILRVGLPTKTYWPTIVAEAAKAQKLFEKEGLTPELTIYRGGAEAFEALAAGAADIVLDPPSLVAAGRKRGVQSKIVAGATTAYNGWFLMVRKDAKFEKAADLAGKKVGITSAGSASDLLATWTMAEHKVTFTKVPLGGGGLVPNLLSGNVDAVVLYSPLSFKMTKEGEAKVLIDFTKAVPKNMTSGWIVQDKLIAEKPAFVQKAVNALYAGVGYLRANRDDAIKLIAETNEVTAEIAALEYENTILDLLTDGAIDPVQVERALDLAKLAGPTNMAPASEIYDARFVPVPKKA